MNAKNEMLAIGKYTVKCFNSVEDAADKILASYNQDAIILTAFNPEKYIRAEKDPALDSILVNSDILYPDGIGIILALKRKYGIFYSRIPGCELWQALIKKCSANSKSIFLVGASSDILNATLSKLNTEVGVEIVGYSDGFFSDEAELIRRIKESNASFVSVAMGTPKQEKFMMSCKKSGVKAILMGVGGTYDVYTGNVKRAPDIWCRLGCEWLYRLLSQPSRALRQVSLIKFAAKLFLGKI